MDHFGRFKSFVKAAISPFWSAVFAHFLADWVVLGAQDRQYVSYWYDLDRIKFSPENYLERGRNCSFQHDFGHFPCDLPDRLIPPYFHT